LLASTHAGHNAGEFVPVAAIKQPVPRHMTSSNSQDVQRMNAIEALLSRHSVSKLTTPAPSGEALQNILQAGLRANDHKRLRPWKFLLIEGEARNRLGELFVRAALQKDPSVAPEKQQDIASKTLRAPLIIVAVAHIKDDPKVPEIEQVLATGGAAQLMMLATHAQGFGGVWRTGDMAYNKAVKEGLGLSAKDHIVGFLYLGTAAVAVKPVEISVGDYVENWCG
jgi:nitroreductase